MATLILIRLDCKTTEDWFGDEIRIVVNGGTVWSGNIDENQQRSLNNLPVPFNGAASIKLYEEDWPDGDDHLGTVYVNDQDTAAVSRAARFTNYETDYTLWYSVYAEPPPDPVPYPPSPNGPTPADPANPDPGPGGGGDPSSPTVPCQLCHLIVEVRDPAESKPVEGAGVRIAARGLSGTTDASGKVDFGPVLPGDFTVEAWKSQYFPFPATHGAHIGAGVTGPTTIEMFISKEKVVEVTPGDTKWYVNLDADEPNKHGRDVTIKAKLSTRTSGVQVYFTIDPDPANRTGLTDDQKASLQQTSALTDNQGEAKVKLKLGTYGGDKYRVSASLNSGTRPGTPGAKESGWITIWRKVYYEIIQMQKPDGSGYWEMPGGTMGYVKTAMENVFLEIISLGAARNIDSSVENFDSAGDAYNWADNYTNNTGVPWKINYSVVGYACTPSDKELEENVGVVTKLVGAQFRPYDFNGTNPILSAKYKPVSGGSWTDFPAGKVTLVGSHPNKQIQVDFTGTGVDPTTTTQKVKIGYKEAFSANGWGGSSLHLIICRGTFEEYYAAASLPTIMAGTSIHEPGHSLGLVMGLAWETADAAHDSHCQSQQCVMWYQGYTGRPRDFHGPAIGDPGCHTYMRGLDMSRSPMQGRWGFPR